MRKKLITVCMALAAFAAFAVVPAVASAENRPILTETEVPQKALAVGTKIKATNVGTTYLKRTDGSVILECTTAVMTGTLVKNSGGNMEGTISSATFAGTGTEVEGEKECTGAVSAKVTSEGLPWCIRSTTTMKTDEFQVRGGDCTKAETKIKFTMATTGIGSCSYEGGPVVGTYHTDEPSTQDALMTVPGQNSKGEDDPRSIFTKSAGGFLCPSHGYLDMDFTLETDTTPTADPIYIETAP